MADRKNFTYGLPGGRAYYQGKDSYASQMFENETRQKLEELASAPFQAPSLTTTQRDALTAENGMIIYNTTTNKFQGYENGAWANLI
jgi:hypothetical protein